MSIKSLFGYAEIIQDEFYRKGIPHITHDEVLVTAAKELVRGYLNLDDAKNETMERINPKGFTIMPDAVNDAANYIIKKGFDK